MGDRSLDDFFGDDDPDDGEETVAEESPDQSDEPADAVGAGAADRENGEVSGDIDTDDEGDAGAETDRTETDDADTDEEGVRVDPSTVEPAESTYAWSRDGGTCVACGETVDRRWRADDGLVCVDCKEW
ncbi:DUF7573 domain-containing protein [Halosimplex marinum]|uniref:DUF7573 domain-containing protein n=1 Tax=Halosimplex marinum TaxID=3396620 RepID=UPI003F57F168